MITQRLTHPISTFALVAGFVLVLNLPVVWAQEATEKINAQILPTIWYSSLDAKEGDKLRIYAGIQNNSGLQFSGSVMFYVDDAKIGEVPFTSESETLKEISAEWTAILGKHLFQAKLQAKLPEGKAFLSSESDKTSFEISEPLTLEKVQADALKTLLAVEEKIDEAAKVFADKLESMKSSAVEENPVKIIASKFVPTKYLASGTSSAAAAGGEVGNDALLASVLNSSLNLASILIRNWPWTLAGLALLYLFFKFS